VTLYSASFALRIDSVAVWESAQCVWGHRFAGVLPGALSHGQMNRSRCLRNPWRQSANIPAARGGQVLVEAGRKGFHLAVDDLIDGRLEPPVGRVRPVNEEAAQAVEPQRRRPSHAQRRKRGQFGLVA